LLSILQAAGWPILPLVLCSIVALALIIERALTLREAKVAPARLVDEVLSVTKSGLPSADTLQKLADNSVLGTVLAHGLQAAAESRGNEERLRSAVEAAGRQAIHTLEKNLTALGTISAAAPLFGLLGTVIGMIEIFSATGGANGSGNPQELAHGISVALYNTAFGLMVAIPSLIAFRHFRARIDTFALQMEQGAERLVQHLVRPAGARR
jgi:biopolymer transport protein ExbB